MQTLQSLWNLLSLLSVIVVPQLLGVLVYFRLKRLHFLAHLIGFILPPVLFFIFSGLAIFATAQREAELSGERVCGTFAGMMVMAIFSFTVIQAFLSLIAQLILHARHRA